MGVDETWLAAPLAFASEFPDALIAIAGPTASGKSELAMELCARLDGEIVSADSVQIYRGFDIGSGKPTSEEQAQVRHHLIDVLDPLDAVDAAQFAAMADGAIRDARSRKKRPIVCGGTFLWQKSLLFGLSAAPPANAEIRERHRHEAERSGRTALHDRLRAVDPISATRLHPNDLVRVSRALEVYELSGIPLSTGHAEHALAAPRYDARVFAVGRTPEDLTTRIEERVRIWLESGWIEETKALLDRGCGAARAMGSVGYREIRAYLGGALPREELGPTIVRATRVFARRQRTWLRSAEVTWLGLQPAESDR